MPTAPGWRYDTSPQKGCWGRAAFAEYVYFDGERVARRDYQNNVLYYFEDQVNSSRAIVGLASGSGTPTLCYDADFFPFGGEHQYINTCGQNYKFMGKERDTETGNDDFGARYYASAYGRFLSADWSSMPAPVPYANLTNPQTFNLYSIVSDNPVSFADLDGHSWLGTAADWESQPAASNQQQAAPPNPGAAQNQSAQQQNDQQQNSSKLDKDKFVNYMDQNAKNKSTGFCAMACRKGLAAGGLNTSGHPGDAKDYGPFLVKNGASVVPNKGYKPEKGDIVVFEGNKSHPYGHIEVYNGKGWVSDFKQHSMIPYRSDVPPHAVYRFPDDQ